ncbi:MAG: nitronate monooxygenase [Lautropia sp.]
MNTAACSLFGIETPIFAFSHCRDVVVEATKAGGLGVLGASTHRPEQLRIDLAWIEARVGGRPYGIDVIMPSADRPNSEGGHRRLDLAILESIPAGHFEFVESLLSEYGIPDLPAEEKERSLREYIESMTFSRVEAERRLEVAFDCPNLRLVVSALGPAPTHVVDRAHAKGIRIGGMVGNVKHAKVHVAAGADLIIATGYEAGGHTGEVTTMVLVPEIAQVIAPVPVLAAGGIGNGQQMAAALALGAQGVWCGTIWLGTVESEASPEVQAKIFASSSADTVRTRCNSGKPARRLLTAWTEAWDRADTPEPLPMPLQGILTHLALKRIERAGQSALLTYPAGQVVGQMNEQTTVRNVFRDMLSGYAEAIERLESTVGA